MGKIARNNQDVESVLFRETWYNFKIWLYHELLDGAGYEPDEPVSVASLCFWLLFYTWYFVLKVWIVRICARYLTNSILFSSDVWYPAARKLYNDWNELRLNKII